MSVWNNKAFTENEFSRPIKIALTLLVILPTIAITIHHIFTSEVKNPYAFLVTLIGFILFSIPKIYSILKRKWVTFGTKQLSENMANLYRIGYWLMVMGIIWTFV